MERREFLRLSAGLGALTLMHFAGIGCQREENGTRVIPAPTLPYRADALEPHVSKRTVELHFGKHHKGYAEAANGLLRDNALRKLTIEQIIRKSHNADRLEQSDIFNNVAQAYNHAFYWKSLRAKGGGEPTGRLMERLESSFGNYAGFRDAFEDAAMSRFASGWVWLVYSEDRLEVIQTPNAENPLVRGKVPLLTVDLWEHAYYLDYQNRRVEYVKACLDHLLNWEFATANLGEIA
ncbi:MAG: superoxide dismutase [Desulfobacterales bacterium]